MSLMTDRKETKTKVLATITDALGFTPSVEASIEDLGMDSLDYLDLLVKIDDACGVDIGADQAAKALTVRDLIEVAYLAPENL